MVGNLGLVELLIIALWFALVFAAVAAFFRGMRALVEMSRRLERIEAMLVQAQRRDTSGAI